MAPKKRVPPPPSSDDEKEDTLIKAKGSCTSDDEEEEEVSSEVEKETPKPETKTKSGTGDEDDEEEEEEEVDEDDDEEVDEDDDDDEDEDEHEQTPAKKPIIQKPNSPSGSSSESESESDADSGKTQNSPTASAFTVKPILSKPMPESTKPKKPDSSKPVNAKPLAKRAVEPEMNGAKDSKTKKMKVSNEDVRSEEKRPAVTRLWSDEDEIVVLRGMVNYGSIKGVDPNADMTGFYDSIKGELRVDVSKSQLYEKVRRLKKKYLNNVQKSGNDAVFSKPHDHLSFELSKKIWGGNSNAVDDGGKGTDGEVKKSGRGASNGKVLAKPKEKAIVMKEEEEVNGIEGGDEVMDVNGDGEFATMYPFLNAALEVQLGTEPFLALSVEDRRLIKAKLIDGANVKEMNDEWKMYKMEEFELYVKKLKLMKDMTGMLFAALKSEESNS